ncbi:MAG TPA: His-Xaa-Ser system protein HxsD [Nitrospirae bacterium]|nr:His-Xaa-Ser system protein HxsD [Nitrospirota bacterium]
MDIIQRLETGKLILRVDKSMFHREAILSAAYKFTDSCYIQIASLDSDYYGVYFTSKSPNIDLDYKVNGFCNELIDQQLRHNLDDSNKSIKAMIIKKAFFPFHDE